MLHDRFVVVSGRRQTLLLNPATGAFQPVHRDPTREPVGIELGQAARRRTQHLAEELHSLETTNRRSPTLRFAERVSFAQLLDQVLKETALGLMLQESSANVREDAKVKARVADFQTLQRVPAACRDRSASVACRSERA